MLVIILVALLLALLYKYITKNDKYWEDKNILHEKPQFLIGNLASVISGKESLGMTVKRLYESFDENIPYFGLYVFNKPYLILKSPEAIKQVLIKDFNAFPNRPAYSNKKIDPIAASVLFNLKNDEWRELRKKLTPIFTTGKLKMMFPLIKEITDDLQQHLEKNDGHDIEVKGLAKRYTIDTISSCAFGIKANAIEDQNSELHSMVSRMLDMRKFKRVFAAFAYFFCPILVKIFRFPFLDKESAEYLINVFNNVSEERKKMNVKRHDLIDCLHSIQKEETENDIFKFDNITMSSQALVFFNAGSEPASLITSFLLYELAIQPEIQNRLRTEILKKIDSKGSISHEILNDMKYLDMVLNEALRKYPLAQLLFRYAEEDYTFKDTGLTIEKGTPVLIPTLALHLDPKYYPDPQKFDPERFNFDKPEVFLPFGDGPRKCIGDRFAIIQMKTAIVTILRKFEVTPCEKTEIPMKLNMRSFFLMPKTGTIYLNIKKIAA